MKGKICLVTGGTSGIGLATAQMLAQQGATVVVAGRDARKGESVVARIKQASGSSEVDFLQVDLTEQAQVHRLATEMRSRHPRLDVLINNAGAIFLKRQLSTDGIEMTLATNLLAPFLLTNLLLDMLKSGAPSRVVNVSSDMQKGATLDFDNLQGERKYNSFRAYGQSKLGLIIFTYDLARRLEGTGITVNAVHPGFVATNIGKNNGWLAWIILPMLRPFALSPQKGAETSVYVATSPEVSGMTGRYFVKKKPVPSSPISYDESVAQRLWDVCAKLTGLETM